jgi:3-oxoacyl-[acyl-carrier protein] reductase
VTHGAHPAPEYAAGKAAVVRLTLALAGLADSAGVRVTCICPDWVDTPMSRRAIAGMAEVPAMLRAEDIADAIADLAADQTLAGRILVHRCGEAPRLLTHAESGVR